MSRLSDLINEAIILNTRRDGSMATSEAVQSIKPVLDDESRDVLVTEALTIRVTDAAKRSKSGILNMAKRQNYELPFNLHGAYPIDGHYIKRTEDLTRAEFQRVINIREKQIIDDTRNLADLRIAFTAADPLWDLHPDWTFGQCCAAMIKAAAA